MKKVLFVANHKGFSKFNAPFMQWFKDQGWRVDNASPGIEIGNVDNQYDVKIERSPFSLNNISAYKQLKAIIDCNNYDIIHCHTAMGGFLARLAGKNAQKKGTKIIYTSHGFHFFKGSPIKYWLLFFPLEILLSKWTNVLVTINQEDYELGVKFKMATNAIYKIDGVGVNLSRFKPLSSEQKNEKRSNLGFRTDDFIILYIAQFIARKNHKLLIKAVPSLLKVIPNLKVVLVGSGEKIFQSKKLAEDLRVNHIIHFIGGRSDVDLWCGISDMHVATSLQEGQGLNNIEAMACGCPIVVSRIRGHVDVCIERRNGLLFDLENPQQLESSILEIYNDQNLYMCISENNKVDAKKYSVIKSTIKMGEIYKSCLSQK